MSKPSILVVDDTAANIKILADLLRRDYLLSVATSGPDAPWGQSITSPSRFSRLSSRHG